MRVVHITSHDSGGAGIACIRLHKALLESGVDSIVLTQSKTTHLSTIHKVAKTKLQKLIAKIRPHLSQIPLMPYTKRIKDIFSPRLPFFTPRNHTFIQAINTLKPDVVHLHWIEGGFFHLKDLQTIHAPLLWSLHDANPYTGGCHIVPNSCVKLNTHCKSCPLLHSKNPLDIAFWTFRQKAKVYKKLNITINGLSRWITQNAKDSALFKAKPIIHIPNPIDTNIYAPIDRNIAQKLLNITRSKRFLSFGIFNDENISQKSIDVLASALDSLPTSLKQEYELLIFGTRHIENQSALGGIPTHYLGKICDEISLALIYHGSDVLITPRITESLSQIARKNAPSHTTFIISSDTTKAKDLLSHKHNAYLAKSGDIQDLSEGIQWALQASYSQTHVHFQQTPFHPSPFSESNVQHPQNKANPLRYIAQHSILSLFPSISRSHFLIGFAAIGGASVPRKGFYELASALDSLPIVLKQKCEFLIFGGDAPHIPGIKTHILGQLSDDVSLALAYNACYVFVAPSLAENLSNVIMESLSCGTPVVGFDIGGNSDLIQHKNNGYLAKSGDIQDLSEGIQWILDLNTHAYENLTINARQSVCENFTAHKIAQAYKEAYRKLTGGGA